MLVLGIDPGTATTGYGLVREDDAGMALLDCGIISTPASHPLPARLQTIYRELASLISRHRPDSAAVEELFFSRNVRTALSVGQARGVTLLAIADAGLPIHEYTPQQVKQAITGYGGADKRQVQAMVRLLLNLDLVPEPDDAADAVAVAICHLQSAAWKSLISELDSEGMDSG